MLVSPIARLIADEKSPKRGLEEVNNNLLTSVLVQRSFEKFNYGEFLGPQVPYLI
jgi:hypothetical protein